MFGPIYFRETLVYACNLDNFLEKRRYGIENDDEWKP